ncbi:MAG TPA: helix-hairpin-helix domain-containing protein [Longimicrobiales bacterium]
MTGEERKAVAFVAILLGLSAVARAVNRPNPVHVTGASAIPIDDRLAENQQVRERVSRPSKATTPPRKPAPAPTWRTAGTGVVIDNRPPKGSPPEPLNLNRATAAELDALPGISPAVAGRIVEYRTSRGSFSSVEQLDSVKGIGPKLLEKVRPLVKLR